MRRDDGGAFWDTLFDVVSLAVSIVEVINDPSDTWAWVGLALDVVDLIPFVSGAGEAADALRVYKYSITPSSVWNLAPASMEQARCVVRHHAI